MSKPAEAQMDDYDFESNDAGASATFNSEAGQIRVGGYLVMKSRPTKVTSIATSKTGKHGHAKCAFVGIDIFNGKKYEDMSPSTHTVQCPVVKRADYTLLNIEDEYCSLMDADGNEKTDPVRLPDWPEGFAREIIAKFESGATCIVSVLTAMNHEQIMAIKEEDAK